MTVLPFDGSIDGPDRFAMPSAGSPAAWKVRLEFAIAFLRRPRPFAISSGFGAALTVEAGRAGRRRGQLAFARGGAARSQASLRNPTIDRAKRSVCAGP